MTRDAIGASLSLMRPEDLYPTWCLVDRLEEAGEIGSDEARRWKGRVFALMECWGLDADDLV